MEDDYGRILNALDIAYKWGSTDGSHHKAWVIDQMVRELLGDNYTKWVAEVRRDGDDEEAYEWDEGIAP